MSNPFTQRSVLKRRKTLGFTLIELMVVVAAVGILAGIAYPSYTEHVRRSRMGDAQAKLAELRVKQEQFYADNRNYGSTSTNCSGLVMPSVSQFTFTCAARTSTNADQTFLVTATGSGSMAGYTFTVNDRNERTTTAFVGASSGLPFACWKTRVSDTC